MLGYAWMHERTTIYAHRKIMLTFQPARHSLAVWHPLGVEYQMVEAILWYHRALWSLPPLLKAMRTTCNMIIAVNSEYILAHWKNFHDIVVEILKVLNHYTSSMAILWCISRNIYFKLGIINFISNIKSYLSLSSGSFVGWKFSIKTSIDLSTSSGRALGVRVSKVSNFNRSGELPVQNCADS